MHILAGGIYNRRAEMLDYLDDIEEDLSELGYRLEAITQAINNMRKDIEADYYESKA